MKRQEFEALRDWWVKYAQDRDSAIELVAYSANVELRQALGEPPGATFANSRDSLGVGVEAIQDDPGSTATELHESWMRFKFLGGWGYGLKFDVQEKLHPNMVAYADLPEEQRWKDELFGAIVRAGLGLGLEG